MLTGFGLGSLWLGCFPFFLSVSLFFFFYLIVGLLFCGTLTLRVSWASVFSNLKGQMERRNQTKTTLLLETECLPNGLEALDI